MNIINDFDKMKSIARVLKLIFSFLFWAFAVVGILLIIGAVTIYFVPDKYFVLTDFYEGDLVFAIEGMFRYEFTNELAGSLMLKPIILIIIPAVLLSIAFYLVNFRQLQLILGTVINDEPFHSKNSNSLFIMSIAFVVASFLFQISGNIVFGKIFEVIGIVGSGFSFSPDFTMLFTGILLLILSGVFKYGNYLQEEYDETV